MARPFGLAKKLRTALASSEMTHEELRRKFPQYTSKQISQCLYEQSWLLPGIRKRDSRRYNAKYSVTTSNAG